MTETLIAVTLFGVALAASLVLAALLKDSRNELVYVLERAKGYERMYDERVDRINALEIDLRKTARENNDNSLRAAELAGELATSQAALHKATETVWEIKGTLERAALTNQRLYDLIVATVNGDAQAARKASEDAVERFLKVADAADRRAGDVLLVKCRGRAQHLAIAAPRPGKPSRVIEAQLDVMKVRPFRRADAEIDSCWRWRDLGRDLGCDAGSAPCR